MWQALNDIIANGSRVDIAIFMCGLVVLGMVIANARHGKETRARLIKMEGKYELLNTLIAVHAWVIHLKLGVRTIKKHRSGDIEIVNPLDKDD